jgi:hypothetical protein
MTHNGHKNYEKNCAAGASVRRVRYTRAALSFLCALRLCGEYLALQLKTEN